MSPLPEPEFTKGRDRPILFSAPMVRALLAGTKTQTRRIIKPQPERTPNGSWHVGWQVGGGSFYGPDATETDLASEMLDGLRIEIGDRLWVREAWRTEVSGFDALPPRDLTPGIVVLYEADAAWGDNKTTGKLRPSMFMPRWASRLTLAVTDVRVQRLHDISEEDAIAEGMNQTTATAVLSPDELHVLAYAHMVTPHALGRIIFETVWEQINGTGSWQANPWVAAYSFSVEHRNIDAPASLPLPR